MLTLIFPTQGNPITVKKTIESFSAICDEFIIGSVCIFKEDDELIESYASEYNVKVIKMPFNYIALNGFSQTLNHLASFATNDMVIYANVGELIEYYDKDALANMGEEYNAFYIDHATEKFRWWRCYNRKELKWSGPIHEELVGEYRPFYKPLLRFKDIEKDSKNPFKSLIYNDIKEVCYWFNLMKIVDNPSKMEATAPGWLQFATDNYQTMKDRLAKKGVRPTAFRIGSLDMYLGDILNNPEFAKERFQSNHIIEFQGDPLYLNKK